MTSTQRVIKCLAIALAIFIIMSIFSAIYFGGKSLIKNLVDTDNNIKNIEEYDVEDKVLYIDLRMAELEIKIGDVLKVATDNKYVKVKETDNKLSIIEEKHLFKKAKNNKVLLYLPADIEFDDLKLYTGAGEISIEKINSKRLTMKIGAGSVKINDLSVTEDADIKTGAGKVSFVNCLLNSAKIELGVGKFDYTGIFNGNSNIEAGIGKVNIKLNDDIENYSIRAEKGIGNISIKGNNVQDEAIFGTGDKTLEIKGGIGDIEIN